MEECPVFTWDESLCSSESELMLHGSEAKSIKELGGFGYSDVQDDSIVYVWRSSNSETLDVGLASFCDARENKWRSVSTTAAPMKNGVIVSKRFLGLTTATGDIFVIKDPFTTNSTAQPVLNAQFTPASCCWTRLPSKKYACWIGSEQGEVHCYTFDAEGRQESTYVIEPAPKPASWLNAFARFQKRPILGIADCGSTQEASFVAVILSDGRVALIRSMVTSSRKYFSLVLLLLNKN